MTRIFGCLLLITASLAAAAAAAAPDAYQIFGRARSVWLTQKYPPYLSYAIAIAVEEGGVPKSNHYHATYDALHDRVRVDAVSDEERADPYVPSGTNVTIDPKRRFQTLFSRHVDRPEEAVDFLGVPMLSPNYSFGIAPYVAPSTAQGSDNAQLVREIRQQFNDPMPAEKAQALAASGGLREIGHVTSTNRDYAISNLGLERVDGADVYHLALLPLHSPDKLRLREMWIDAQTYATRRLVTQGNFQNSQVPWLVTFVVVDGVQYIASEEALKPVGSGRHLYQRASISFQTIAPAQPPRYSLDAVTSVKGVLAEPESQR